MSELMVGKTKEEVAFDLLQLMLKSREQGRKEILELYAQCRRAVGAGPTHEEWLAQIADDKEAGDEADDEKT